ncbi:MAG: hypothetical protein RI519_07180, partial [Balneolaceae bacterium]|nr:hypothetical protein [Balneolaceae bacterium]
MNRFFGGDHVPTGRMLLDVAVRLVEKGHSVTALVSSDSYTDQNHSDSLPNGITVHRLYSFQKRWRIINWLLYWVQASYLIPFLKWSRCIILTDPPFLIALAPLIKLIKRNSKIYWWTMDLYPEALVSGQLMNVKNIIYRLLHSFNDLGIKFLDGVIVLGDSQKKRLMKYSNWSLVDKQSLVVPPWDNRTFAKNKSGINLLRHRLNLSNKRVILYAGNLGNAHSYKDIIKAAEICLNYKYEWVFLFVCRGKKKKELEKQSSNLNNIRIRDYVSPKDSASLLHLADCHLITMEDGWEGVVV